jgi:ATP-dependent Lon protease
VSDATRILVIDDEVNVLLSVKRIIASREPGFQVEVRSEPLKGLEDIEEKEYDLLITDLMMPRIDGLELIRRIRKVAPNLKILMMTGYATMKTALLAQREGASKYISKPFTRDELLGAIREVLAQDPPTATTDTSASS